MELLHHSDYQYTGALKRQARCGLRIYERAEGKVVFMTEQNDNHGPSVTNNVEELATQVRREFGLDSDQTTWVEHYPEREWRVHNRVQIEPPSYDEVTFTWVDYVATEPEWRRLDREEVEGWFR
jgi:hypothetical protein